MRSLQVALVAFAAVAMAQEGEVDMEALIAEALAEAEAAGVDLSDLPDDLDVEDVTDIPDDLGDDIPEFNPEDIDLGLPEGCDLENPETCIPDDAFPEGCDPENPETCIPVDNTLPEGCDINDPETFELCGFGDDNDDQCDPFAEDCVGGDQSGAGGLPFDIDLDIDLNDLPFDVSACENLNPEDPSECFQSIQSGIYSIPIQDMVNEQWESFKESGDYQTAKDVMDTVDPDLAGLVDEAVNGIAAGLENEVTTSPLVDWERWEEGLNALGPIMSGEQYVEPEAIEAAIQDITEMPDDFMEAFQQNENINNALSELDTLVGFDGEFEGTAIEAIMGEEDVAAALEALLENGPTEEGIQAAADAIEASEVAQAEIEKVLEQGTSLVDGAVTMVDEFVGDLFEEKVPALTDALKDQLPEEIDSMVDDVWGTVGDVMTIVTSSEGVKAVQSNLSSQISEVEEIAGTDSFSQLVEKTQDLGSSVVSEAKASIAEQSSDGGSLVEGDGDGDFSYSLTASVAALLALAPLAF